MIVKTISAAGAAALAATLVTAHAVSAVVPAAVPVPALMAKPVTAIVVADQASLRAGPRDSAQQQAQLWQGEMVEVRGERLDYLQVWDHQRERGGYVRASQLRRTSLSLSEADEILAVLRHVAITPGDEALGISLAAAWLKAASPEAIRGTTGVEVLDLLGTLADRLARRVSTCASPTTPQGRAAEAMQSAHLDVATRYGVQFTTYEQDGRMQVCYNGDAFRRVLAMKAAPEQMARAALALTRPECIDPALRPAERAQLDGWRAEVLDRVDTATLPPYLAGRVQIRRAAVWSTTAYVQARQAQPSLAAGQRALEALAAINKSELTDDDLSRYNEAAMRVSASRWAAVPDAARKVAAKSIEVVFEPGAPGETCVLLLDAKIGAAKPLVKRCTYAVVWPQSVSFNRESTAMALAVQPAEAWRELWVFRKEADGWTINVLPPAATTPGIGYAEFAGWVPGGAQLLVARESRGEGRYRRSFEMVRMTGLTTEHQAADPTLLGAFQRWQDPAWKRMTVSVR
jgi:hypothetical protein